MATTQHSDFLICYVFSTFVGVGKKGGLPKFFHSSRNMFKSKVNGKTKELPLKTLKDVLKMEI